MFTVTNGEEVMNTIDLNCDMGESFGAYDIGRDKEVCTYITSANIACGYHAGDPLVMDKTVKMAVESDVGVGAHPGYPDLVGFGRRNMDCSMDEIRGFVIYQIGALQAFCEANGTILHHVKPHGALYNTAVQNEEIVCTIAEAISAVNPELLCVVQAGTNASRMKQICQDVGVKVVFEAFADRAYTNKGTLLPRRLPGAVMTDPEQVAKRALKMIKDHQIISMDGSVIPIEFQTLCVHGDTPGAVELVRHIRQTLEIGGVTIKRMDLI